MATLTYDPTEQQEGEFNEEELDSLQVGEELAQQEANLLAGKFRDAEELEQAYMELQRKLGSRETDEPEQEAEQEAEQVEEEEDEEYSPAVGLIQEASNEYYANNGQLSEETISKFSELSSQELVQAYLQMQANQPQQQAATVSDLSPQEVNVIQNSVGGQESYSQMVQWASENLDPSYVDAFDNVIESGNMQAIQLAVAGLRSEYENQVGYEGRMFSGKAPMQQVDTFRSQAEVVRAMSDPRYETDPAYRQDIYDKLERSNIQY
jgi:hypothetical protein